MFMEAHLRQQLQRARQLSDAGRPADAAATYRLLLSQHPTLADAWYELGILLRRTGQYDAAIAAYAKALACEVRDPEEVHLNIAVIQTDHLHDHVAAEQSLRCALAIDPGYVPAWLNLGNLHEDLGRREQAIASYTRILHAPTGEDRHAALRLEALARLVSLHAPSRPDDPLLLELKASAESPRTIDDTLRANLLFALGRAYDAMACYPQAFAAFEAANRASARRGPAYHPAAMVQRIDVLIGATPAAPSAPPSRAADRRLEPLFICGMFRSGSTLVEQVLHAHPQVAAGGELNYLAQLAAGPLAPFPASLQRLDAATAAHWAEQYRQHIERIVPIDKAKAYYFSDKRPDNFLLLGLVARLFPTARIIHTTRDPLDNCVSIFVQHLDQRAASYSSDLAAIGHYYGQYRRLMRHFEACFGERLLRFDYDQFVREPEPTLRRLLDFLELPWDPRCLDFHEQRNAVKTASYWQVRRPLYRESSGRSGNYREQLAPLRRALQQAGVSDFADPDPAAH
jgi:tetratricopeptide (TPR) repeat protein